jgi:hypothetical protein
MRRLIALTLLTSIFLGACTFTLNYEEGSGQVETEVRSVAPFERISFEGLGNLTITQGSGASLRIEAEDNILPRIVTEVHGDELSIGFDTDRWENIIRPTKPITYYLQVETLSELSLSGLGNVKIDELAGGRLTVRLSGAGSIDASGAVEEQSINVSGAGSYQAGDLRSSTVTINLSGAGNAELWVTDILDISISGLGNVRYYGDPVVHQSITGLGNIQALGEH